jgi:signal transduction histidine kinase/DNA-binding response OmpR family regulator
MKNILKNTKQHINVRVLRSYINYIDEKNLSADISKFLEPYGLTRDYFRDDNNWVSLSLAYDLTEKLKEITKNNHISFDVGLTSLAKENLGSSLFLLLNYLIPFDKIIPKSLSYSKLLNNVCEFSIPSKGHNFYVFSISKKNIGLDAHEIKILDLHFKNITSSFVGYLEAAIKLKGVKKLVLETEENPNDFRVFLKYRASKLSSTKKNIILYSSLIAASIFVYFLSDSILYTALSMFFNFMLIGIHAVFKFKYLDSFIEESDKNLEKVNEQYKELHEQKETLERRLKEKNLVQSITQSLINTADQTDLLNVACKNIVEILAFDRAVVFLKNSDSSSLIYAADFGEDQEFKKLVKDFSIDINIDSNDMTKFGNVFKHNVPVLISDVASHLQKLQAASQQILAASRSKSFICVPIYSRNDGYGLLITDCYKTNKVLVQDDLELLKVVSDQIALYLEKQIAQAREIKALKESDKLKDEFLANTSHELKTPLNGIVGIAQSLIDFKEVKANKFVSDNLKLIYDSGIRLTDLVEKILDYSKLKNMKEDIHRREFNIISLCNRVINILRPILESKKLYVKTLADKDLHKVYADEDKIEQIFLNIIGNAIKFTEKGGITIELSRNSESVQFTIADTGAGVAEHEIDKIFKAFTQADGTTKRRHGGTGLGLSISKEIIELHQGTVKFTSKKGEGSTVKIVLPNAYVVAQSSEVLTTVEAKNPEVSNILIPSTFIIDSDYNISLISKEKILVVDDEPINIQVLKNHLSDRYQIIEAMDGFEAIEMTKVHKPQLILMDVMMPNMDGYEACRSIRKDFSSTNLPIIFLTAKRKSEEDIVHGLTLGGNDYLPKPFMKSELLARIDAHLGASRIALKYSQFVPWKALSLLNYKSILDVKIGDHIQREMSVLFSDIRNFTTLCERQTSEEVITLLNNYLACVSPFVSANDGLIDKFIGDCVMALFENPRSAILAAIQMNQAIHEFNIKSPVKLKSGYGIKTGKITFGPIGFEGKLDITALSDSVNVASRLDGLCKLFGAPMIVCENTLNESALKNEILIRPLGFHSIRGKVQKEYLFEVFDGEDREVKEQKLSSLSRFTEAMGLFDSGKLIEASKIFTELKFSNPKDKALDYLLSQCFYKDSDLEKAS